MNAQNLPRFSKIHLSNGNRGADGIWELSVLATCGRILKIYTVLLEFIEKKKMENRVKDWIWHPRIYSTRRTNSQNLPCLSRIH